MALHEIRNCFILNTYTLEALRFQYMPEAIRDYKSAIWEQVPIILRSEPLQGYAGSSARTISFDLRFFCETDPYEDVKTKIDFIRSLVYPIYGRTIKSPPLVVIVVGKLLRTRCIVKDYNFIYTGPWELDTMYCYDAMVGLTFEEVNTVPFDHFIVRKGKDTAKEVNPKYFIGETR